MPQILGMMQMAFDSEDPPIPHAHRGGPRPSYDTHPMAPGNLAAAAMLAQGHMSDEDDMGDLDAGDILASFCVGMHHYLMIVTCAFWKGCPDLPLLQCTAMPILPYDGPQDVSGCHASVAVFFMKSAWLASYFTCNEFAVKFLR